MNVYEIAKTMTRENFLYETQGQCPKTFGLNNDKCEEFDDCPECREDSIKDIIFKGEENISNDDLQNNNKRIFNLKEFKDNDICITCKSKTEAEQFINILIINGITNWTDGEELKIENTYCYSSITYSFDIEEKGGLYFSQELDYFLDNNYIILEFSKVDFSQVWNKDSIAEVALNNESKNEINYKEEIKKLEKQNEELENNSLKYYNEAKELRDKFKNNELINEIDKKEHKKDNETILSQYSKIQELKQIINKLKSDLEVYESVDEDEISNQDKVIDEQNEEIHNLDSIIKDLQAEKKTLKTQVEFANNRCESIANLNQQFRQIIKQFSEIL